MSDKHLIPQDQKVAFPFTVEVNPTLEFNQHQIGGFSSDGNRVIQVVVSSFDPENDAKIICEAMNDYLTKFNPDIELDYDDHIDCFIDYGTGRLGSKDDENELYARFILDHFRRPAITKIAFDEFYKDKKLFATYKDERYRVTGASRLGDVWITKDFDQDSGYQARVSYKDLSNWSDAP